MIYTMEIKSQMFCIVLKVICLVAFSHGHKLNYSAMMREYYLLCGPDYFCYGSDVTHKFDISPNYSYRHLRICPECLCDFECIKRGDCCPDMFFAFPELKCVNRTIINAREDEKRTEQFSALMVTGCQTTSDPEIKDKCLDLNDTKSRLTNPPVSSRGDNMPLITYFNKYCAECNGVTNYTSWVLDINCIIFADFNFLSTIDEIIEMAYAKKCILQYYRPEEILEAEKEENCFDINEKETLLISCNETNEWTMYDSDIIYACESYFKGKLRIFKNVFCYMCNPSGQSYFTNIISSCNVTGQWKTYDEGLESACINLPSGSATAPFKNVFCYLCNRGNENNQPFVDIDGKVEEFVLDNNLFRYGYNLSLVDFNLEYFEFETEREISADENLAKFSFQPFSNTSFRTVNGTLMNLTNLLRQVAAVSISSVNVCPTRRFILPEGFSRDCTCDPTCLSKHYGCCEDLLLEMPTVCLDEHELSKDIYLASRSKGYLVINGCFQEKTHSMFRKRCASVPQGDDIFSTLALNDINGLSYNNFYCVLCNLESNKYVSKMNGSFDPTRNYSSKITQTKDFIKNYLEQFKKGQNKYDIWDFYLVCPTYLDFTHILRAGCLLQLARQIKCKIQYKNSVDTSSYCSRDITQMKTRCGDVSNWTYTDPEVDWACNKLVTQRTFYAPFFGFSVPEEYQENLEHHFKNQISEFTNVFCALCKPVVDSPMSFIENCSSEKDSTYCTDLPLVYYYYPFKNYHCLVCNKMYVGVIAQPSPPTITMDYVRITGRTWYPLLRNLFSISQDEIPQEKVSSGDRCGRNQVYDEHMKTCRNITCFNGKYLMTNSCVPVLEITQNLRYSLHFKADIYHGQTFRKSLNITSVLLILKNELWSRLKVKKLYLEDIFYQIPNSSISFGFFTLFVRLDLFVDSSVHRLDFESTLLNFRKLALVTDEIQAIWKIQLSPYENIDFDGIDLLNPGIEYVNDNRSELVYIVDSPPIDAMAFYKVWVTETLLCRQIELSVEEFNLTGAGSGLFLQWRNTQISFEQFSLTPDGSYRICFDYLERIGYFSTRVTTSDIDVKLKNLWIISFVCTVISAIFLFLSLLVYCLFSVLRTTPGKLLMIMMSSLLTTLALMLLSYYMVDSHNGCMTVGMILHFSWLCVFTSMQACNFHLFRTFTRSSPRGSSKIGIFDKTLLKYSIYVFGVSFSVVLLNILISRAVGTNSVLGYGGYKCFIENTFSLIAVFIFPVCIICVSNIVFFALTIRAIHNTPNPDGNTRERNELRIFFRLSSVTGVSWLLQIIDSFLPLTSFSFVATIVNSLQGLFIFLAFIVNSRNIRLIRNRFVQVQESSAISSSKTASSSVPQSSRNTYL